MNSVLVIGPGESKFKGGQVTHCKNLVSAFEAVEGTSVIFFSNGIGAHDAEFFLTKIIRFLSKTPRLLKNIIKADLVHVNTTIDIRSVLRDYVITLLCRILNTDYVVQIHGGSFERIENTRFVKKCAISMLNNSLRTLVFFKQNNLDLYVSPSKQVLASNFVIEERSTLGNKKRFDSTKIHLLYLGRIEKNKGIYELVNWLSSTSHFPKIAKITIAGDGPDRAAVQQQCELLGLPIVFTGFVDSQQKELLFEQADFLILPSYAEAFPYTIIESMGFGLPVIATSVGAIPHIIEHRKTGFLLENLESVSFDNVFNLISDRSFDYEHMCSLFHGEIVKYDLAAMIKFFNEQWSGV